MRGFMAIGRRRGRSDRAHRTPRRSLFTPHRVSGGPGRNILMDTRRITKGTFVGTGVRFVEIDDYSDLLLAHKILANAWVGTTEIHEKQFDEQETQNIIEPDSPAGDKLEDKEKKKKYRNNSNSKDGVTHALMSLAPRRARAHAAFLSSELGRRDRRVGRSARTESAALRYLGGECGRKLKSHIPRLGLCAAACCRQGSIATHCAKNQTFHPQSVEHSLPRRRLWVRGSASLGTGTLRDYIVSQADSLATWTGESKT